MTAQYPESRFWQFEIDAAREMLARGEWEPRNDYVAAGYELDLVDEGVSLVTEDGIVEMLVLIGARPCGRDAWYSLNAIEAVLKQRATEDRYHD